MEKRKKFMLSESEIPRKWYNIVADMPNKPQPLINPETRQPLAAKDLYPLFAEELCRQEFNETESWIECFETVQRLLAEVVFGVLNDARKKRKDEIVELADAHSDIQPQDDPPELPTAKKRGNGKRPAGALTVKQLRYMGYLYRKLGEEPEYDEISSLTQSQATVRIKELEQRVNG